MTLDAGLLHGDYMTITGRSITETLAGCAASSPPPRYMRGVLAKYARLVGSASRSAVTEPS